MTAGRLLRTHGLSITPRVGGSAKPILQQQNHTSIMTLRHKSVLKMMNINMNSISDAFSSGQLQQQFIISAIWTAPDIYALASL